MNMFTEEMLNEVNDDNQTIFHINAIDKTLDRIPKELFTLEHLNKKAKNKSTVWHLAAINDTLKHIPEHLFTSEALAQKDISDCNVWYYAARNKTLSSIPIHLFTSGLMTYKCHYDETVLHIAAQHGSLKDIPVQLLTVEALSQKGYKEQSVFHDAVRHKANIPEHLFTEEALSLVEEEGNTVFHTAANYGNLKAIPKHLFTEEAFNKKNFFGDSVWHLLRDQSLTDIPKRLITRNLLNEGFGSLGITYIEEVVKEREDDYEAFVKNNEHFQHDIDFIDPRLVLEDVNDNKLIFKFTGIKDRIVLANNEALFKNKPYNSLHDVVRVIEQAYPNIEQSISIPSVQSSDIEGFVL